MQDRPDFVRELLKQMLTKNENKPRRANRCVRSVVDQYATTTFFDNFERFLAVLLDCQQTYGQTYRWKDIWTDRDVMTYFIWYLV